jgi:PAS domain S-box-containing protein
MQRIGATTLFAIAATLAIAASLHGFAAAWIGAPAVYAAELLAAAIALASGVYLASRRAGSAGSAASMASTASTASEWAASRDALMLRTLIDNLPDFIYVKDAECRFLLANAAVARHMGTTPEHLLGKSDFDFFEPALARAYSDDEHAVMTSRQPLLNRQEAGVDAQGNAITILTTKVPLFDSNGRCTGILGIGRDITARVKSESEVRAARDAAEAANRSKSEFLANMSHEIRTPLNGVLGMADLLLDTRLDREQREFAETIRDSGKSLLTVINDILDFSKIEAGKLEIEALDFDLHALARDVSRLLAIHAHNKGLELTVSVDPNLPQCLRGDPHRLRQILLNLGGNAVKFTSRGEVGLEITRVTHDASGVEVRFDIRDSGIGIPKDRLSSLFQPFSQVDASTTRRFGGTGLGLSIVRRLVELMNGTCGVDSEEGKGSHFWFTLRLEPGNATNVPLVQLHPAALRGKRALVVDDNATNRRILEAQLRSCGMNAVLTATADEALERLRRAAAESQLFDVALLDHDMPGCNGAELGARINAESSLSATRLIMLTSSGQHGDSSKFAKLGFAGYLLKPVVLTDLIEALTLALEVEAEEWHAQTHPIITQEALRVRRAGTPKKRVLLAEDNAVNQRLARHILEKMEYEVDVVADGELAIEAWSQHAYDVILMDCQMPRVDGYEATRRIRELEGSRGRIPIVALTAHAMKGADEECFRAGMDAYLSKPLDRDQLRACLQRVLEQRRDQQHHKRTGHPIAK